MYNVLCFFVGACMTGYFQGCTSNLLLPTTEIRISLNYSFTLTFLSFVFSCFICSRLLWGLFYCFTVFTTFTASLQILHDSPRSHKIFKNKNQTKQKGLPRFPPLFLYFPSNQTYVFSLLPRLELCLLHTTLDFQTLKPNQPR